MKPPRIPLGDIENALRDPSAYRSQLESGNEQVFGETYAGALRQAIFRYHSTKDSQVALAYLEGRLTNSQRLRNPARIRETMDDLEWYVDEHATRGWQTFQAPVRLMIPPPLAFVAPPVCSGEVGRLDLVPAGGYAGWLFSGDVGVGWERQIRFPLIQHGLSVGPLGVSPSEIQVGVCDFRARRVALHRYSDGEIARARGRLTQLLKSLGFKTRRK